MPSRKSAAPDDIEMSTVFDALARRARRIVVTSIALGAITFGILSLMAPKYQSEAELAIVARGTGNAFADRGAAMAPDTVTSRMDKEAVNTHVKSMQSADLLERIAGDLKLKDRPEFNNALGPVDTMDQLLRLCGIGGPRAGESERDRVLGALRSRLEVYSVKESRFIGVRMTSIDPALAADVANAVGEKYRASLAEQGIDEIGDQQSVLKGKIDKLTPEVVGAETEADRYRGKIDGFRGGAQNTGLNDQQMSDLTAELTRAKAARGEAEARARSAREMMKLGTADALADVQKSPLIQNLVQQRVRIEREISELSATLLPGHPRMRQLNADLNGLKIQLTQEIAKIVESLDKEAKVAQGREDSIKQSLDDIKSRVVTSAPEEAQLRQLDAVANAKRVELDSLQAQLESNRKKLDARAQPVEAEMISKAQPASVPIFPKKIQSAALITLASLMLGTALTVAKALFAGVRGQGPADAHIRRDYERRRAEPVLVEAPSEPRSASRRAVVREPATLQLSEPSISQPMPRLEIQIDPTQPTKVKNGGDIAALAKRIAASRTAEIGHRTLLTGENDVDNPPPEAVDLVKSIAAGGASVILIDWSPSCRGLAQAAGLKSASGLNDMLRGDAHFENIIQRLPGSSAHAIASGQPLIAPGSAADPDQLNLVLDALDEAYDHIVVVGRLEEARTLFETIEGRFDTGIVVAEARRGTLAAAPPGTFLGFEVADIDIVRFERPSAAGYPNPRAARAIAIASDPMANSA